MEYTQKLLGSVTSLFGWYKKSTLISVLVLSVQTGFYFYFNSKFTKETVFNAPGLLGVQSSYVLLVLFSAPSLV